MDLLIILIVLLLLFGGGGGLYWGFGAGWGLGPLSSVGRQHLCPGGCSPTPLANELPQRAGERTAQPTSARHLQG
jgi:hypothetical protein